MIKDIEITASPQEASEMASIKRLASRKLGCNAEKINEARIVRRSIDARKSPVKVNLLVRVATEEDRHIPLDLEVTPFRDVNAESPSVIIVGAGPAGLFAALRCLQLGIRPVVLERGEDVDTRRIKLAEMSRTGIVDPESNYSFGEGGAGTYSDGKLFTRSKKRGNVEDILRLLVAHGAKEEILIDSHPHIGSDRLPLIIKNIRETILKHGGEVRFNCRVTGIILEDGKAKGVELSDGEKLHGEVILATGHSARDVYRMLHAKNIGLEAKGLAIGTRLEHPQHLIDQMQYHSKEGRGKYLPAAEYNFVTQADGRGVYSFCMCPGGIIVPAATSPGQSVVNGMSPSNRGSRWANSGLVVQINPGDFPEYQEHGPLELMMLQEDLEKRFFDSSQQEGRNPLSAPAQRMMDFTESQLSADLPKSSLATGVHSAPLHTLLPPFIAKRMQQGLKEFGQRNSRFLTNEAILVGLESRTSSPVRIPRDKETLASVSTPGLYPAGEGAGYAGGIVSAAIDGMRCAEAFAHINGIL